VVLVVGLGNPGRKYEQNRHNVGFLAVTRLAALHGFSDFKEKFRGNFAKGDLAVGSARYPVAVLKPATFMNLSGESVQPAAAFLKVDPAAIVVVHDELDLAWQDIRLKVGGGHAGHNGLRSIMGQLGSADFVRVRIGIGRPPANFRGDVASFVLQDFNAIESTELGDVLARACTAIEKVVASGVAAAMNDVNCKMGGPGKKK
jgi:PTH1 family peptidyl-tRNA hydrolase